MLLKRNIKSTKLEETEIMLDTYQRECIRIKNLLDQQMYSQEEKIINIEQESKKDKELKHLKKQLKAKEAETETMMQVFRQKESEIVIWKERAANIAEKLKKNKEKSAQKSI